jgi:hypothetical protein
MLPARYLTQLCKHFAHRLPVTIEGSTGSIAFPGGTCTLQAGEAGLHLRLAAADAAALATLQDVVARHLLRFAFREQPELRWSAAA